MRLVQLYALLRSTGRPYTLGRLAGMFRCSRQTILRMMEQIERLPDLELHSWLQRKERIYRIESHAAPSNVVLTPEAIRHLALCQEIVRHLLPGPLHEELREALDVVSNGVPDSADSLESIAKPWAKGQIDYTPYQSVLLDIQTALHERRLCEVVYQARSSGGRHNYLAAPLNIIAFREALYLRCRLYDSPGNPAVDFRTLAIHRITRLRLQTATYPDKAEDDRDPHFGFPFHKPIRVRVAFWGGAATYVGERTWSEDQKITRRRDGALVLSFTATSRFEVIAWILGFGPEAELLAPKDLRNELRGQVAAIGERYAISERGAPPGSLPIDYEKTSSIDMGSKKTAKKEWKRE